MSKFVFIITKIMVKNQTIFMDNLTAIDKSLLQGKYTTVQELLSGLKSNVFSSSTENSIVTLSTDGNINEPLTLIFKCQHCNALHLESGYNGTEFEIGDVVYIDKTSEMGDYISIQELISILEEEVNNEEFMKSPISIACSIDDRSYPMTMLIRCSEECPHVHITSYVKNEIIMN